MIPNPVDQPAPCTKDPTRWDVPLIEHSSAVPDVKARIESALLACHTCQYEDDCREAAYANRPAHDGVQGGVLWINKTARPFLAWTPHITPGIAFSRGTGLQPCGTPAAYERHERAGEKPCDDCAEAMSNYRREESARRRARRKAQVAA